jgi:hypothetical protein
MTDELETQAKDELQYLIGDWYWDKKSYEFARDMGVFILGFIDHLRNQKLSESTRRRHESNCELIGKLVSDYGHHKKFKPDIFLCEPDHIIEFKRKVSDTNYMVESYKSTWRKITKYISAKQ